jgi:hypothetical protein
MSYEGRDEPVCEECKNAMESIADTVCVLADESRLTCVACGKEVRNISSQTKQRAANHVCEDCESAMESIADTVYLLADEPAVGMKRSSAGAVIRGAASHAHEDRQSAMESIADTTPHDDDHPQKRARPSPGTGSPGIRTPIRNPYAKSRQTVESAANVTQAFETPPSSQSDRVSWVQPSVTAVTSGMSRAPIRNPYATPPTVSSATAPHVAPVTQTQDISWVESDLFVTVRLQSPTRKVRERILDAQRRGAPVRLMYNDDDHVDAADLFESSSTSNAAHADAPSYSSKQMSLTCTIDAVESEADRPLQPRRAGEGHGRRLPYL